MKKRVLGCVAIVYVVLMLLPLSARGEEKPGYLALKPGFYFFAGDLDEEHPEGFHGELAYGRHITPNLAVEAASGYFHDGVHNGNDIAGVPITATVKALYPLLGLEPFLGVGLGGYVVWYEGTLQGTQIDDTDAVFGAHISGGVNLDISRNLFAGFEGRYLFTENAELDGVKVDLDGFVGMLVFGLRI